MSLAVLQPQRSIAFSLRKTSLLPALRLIHDTPAQTDLLVRVSRQDREAFSALYDELSSLVFGLALRTTRSHALAEEVAQEVFIQVWDQASRFDPAKGSARSWVATIAHRRAVDVVRRAQASANRDEAQPAEGPAADVAEQVVDVDEHDRVRHAMKALTDLQREAVELAYFGGLTYRQVAERLGAPLGTVKTRMRDGLARIRTTMELTGD